MAYTKPEWVTISSDYRSAQCMRCGSGNSWPLTSGMGSDPWIEFCNKHFSCRSLMGTITVEQDEGGVSATINVMKGGPIGPVPAQPHEVTWIPPIQDQRRIEELKRMYPIHFGTADNEVRIHVHKDKVQIRFENEMEDRVDVVLSPVTFED